jgi:hypothetical protein
MTEKKKHPAQVDNWSMTEKDPDLLNSMEKAAHGRAKHTLQHWHRLAGQHQRDNQDAIILQRVIAQPPAEPSSLPENAFVRRQRYRRDHSHSQSNIEGRQTQYRARVLARTGIPATSGRIPTVHRPVPQSPVPARSRQQSHNRFLRLLGFLLVSTTIVVLVSFLFTNRAFQISQITVVGTNNVVLIQRIRNLGMQGQNIFLLDVPGFIKKIDAQPEVDSADLTKQWPNQIAISVTERVPVLLWQAPNGTFSVDSQGMVIALADGSTGAQHLGTIIATSPSESQSNTERQLPAPLRAGVWINKVDVTFAVTLINQLPLVTGIAENSFKLYYNGTIYSSTHRSTGGREDSSGSYSIENSRDGWKVYLGSVNDPNPLNNRLLELRSILDLAQRERLKVATIDLRYGLRPVFTLQQ